MKKIIIFASILLFVGAGCTKTPKSDVKVPANQKNDNAIVQNTETVASTTEQNTVFEKTLTAKSEETGFKIYYPTFIPENLKLDEKSLLVSDGQTSKIITYTLNDAKNPATPLIFIQEQVKTIALYSETTKKGETDYLKDHIKTIQNNTGSFYVLVFSKDEKTSIRISTKTDVIDSETLSKIAESMK